MARKGNPIRRYLCSFLLLTAGVLFFYMLCWTLLGFSLFFSSASKVGVLLGSRALAFFLIKLGCSGGLSFVIVFTIFSLLATEATYMVPSGSAPMSSGALSQNHPVLEGRPVLEGIPVPKEDTWEAVTSPFYCASVIHIPGEIEDPLTLSKLSKLNGFLLFLQQDVHGAMEPGYTQAIQREVDQTAADSLPAKLDSIIRREHARFQIQEPGGRGSSAGS